VVSINGQGLSAPLIKDTVEVPAMMGAVELEFVAYNPGDWMFHCHKPLHMDGGMATLVKIA
jgi:FtsP/CotA-like multicopper oxidase with cupredoxin domain